MTPFWAILCKSIIFVQKFYFHQQCVHKKTAPLFAAPLMFFMERILATLGLLLFSLKDRSDRIVQIFHFGDIANGH